MKSNMGGIDSTLRIVFGTVLMILALTNVVGWWGWLGIVLLVTGLFKFCPLYTICGANTCGAGSNQGKVVKNINDFEDNG
jgi:hypothetical protein